MTTVLERRLREADLLVDRAENTLRELLVRLAAAAQARYPDVADLARDMLFHYFHEPLLERATAAAYTEMAGILDALEAEPHGADRAEHIDRLVWCPQPM